MESTYKIFNLEKVDYSTTHLNNEERNLLLRLLNSFEEIFDGTLSKWGTVTLDLDICQQYNAFNYQYQPVPGKNKETF